MTRQQIEQMRVLSCDSARAWVLRAKLGEDTDGRLLSPDEISAYVKQGRGMQRNALVLYRWRVKQLDRTVRKIEAA